PVVKAAGGIRATRLGSARRRREIGRQVTARRRYLAAASRRPRPGGSQPLSLEFFEAARRVSSACLRAARAAGFLGSAARAALVSRSASAGSLPTRASAGAAPGPAPPASRTISASASLGAVGYMV